MATNFLHYGQLIIPLICLIIFLDNKCKFKVNNKKLFILLCLFGVVFLAFSYKLGIYSTVGLFLPMAYYIGSNVIEINEQKIIKIVYILAFGMAFHVCLNFTCDLLVRGIKCFTRNSHLDFWVWDEYPTTQTAVNYVFLFSIIYYIYIYENNKTLKNIGMVLFFVILLYSFALGRRLPYLILFIGLATSMFYDSIINKIKNRRINIVLKLVLIFFGVCLLVLIIYVLNIFGLQSILGELSIINKIKLFGFKTGRIDVLLETIKLMPSHLFGGKKISAILDIEPHDLWLDTYDYAGVFAYIILIIISILMFKTIIYVVKNNKNQKFKLIIISFMTCVVIQMFLEPIITGSSIFLFCTIIIISTIEKGITLK